MSGEFDISKYLRDSGDIEDQKTDGYKAFETFKGGKRGVRFDIVTDDGQMYGFSYGYINQWMFHPRGFFSFNAGASVVSIEGRGLEKLADLLKQEKLSRINVFNKDEDQEPEETAPKVTRIYVKTRLDNDPQAFDG